MNRVRYFFLWTHRWFGIVAGLYFVLLGLSGSYLVYRDEIDAFLKPELRRSVSGVSNFDLAKIVQLAQGGLGTTKEPSSLWVAENNSRNIELSFNMSSPQTGRKFVTAFVDPATDQYKGQESFKETLSGFLFIFHHDLFMGPLGRTIVAIAGVLMLFVLLGGLYLWWPRKQTLRKALSWPNMKTALQWNLGLHKLSGVYTIVLMVVVTFSGVFLAKPDWFIQRERTELPPEQGLTDAEKVNFQKLQTAMEERDLLQRPFRLRIDRKSGYADVNPGSDDVYRFEVRTAKFLEKNPPKSSAAQLHGLQHDLHEGNYWGELGRLLTFLSGILPLFFYVTGFYTWWKKREFRALKHQK